MNVTDQNAGIPTASTGRTFDFYADSFSYPNELIWEYEYNPKTRKTTTRKNDPPPIYAHHCFVVVRSARQFLFHGAFQPDQPPIDQNGYRLIIRSITGLSDCRPSAPSDRIAIPGFANLRQFSAAHPDLLRQNCGGAWQSYVQRGNWRMILPFTRRGQAGMAAKLEAGVAAGRLPIIHVVTFPRLTINHVLMVFGASTTRSGLSFDCYDPNVCGQPLVLSYDHESRKFTFPRTHYFPGGIVNVYEIYRGLFL